MLQEKLETNSLVDHLHLKLALVEIEKKVIEISCSLMEDEIYSVDDAVDGLMQIIDLIEIERQGIISDMKSGYKQSEDTGNYCKEYMEVYRI